MSSLFIKADLCVKNISFLRSNAHLLRQWKIDWLIFDKDNCITLPHSNQIHPEFQQDWKWLRETFKIAILSNSAGSFIQDPWGRKAQELSENAGVPVIRHLLGKPFCFRALKAFTKGENCAIVGDRVFTDVLLSKFAGGCCKSILTLPINEKLDSIWVRIARKIERLLSARE